MSRHDEHSIPADLQDVAKRLEAERPQASDLELDRMKLKAMSSPAGGARTPRPALGQLFRSGRLATLALAIVLMAGGGAVLASSGGPTSGSSHESASKKEYEDDDCGFGQDEKGRNKSKTNNDVCQSCEKVSSNQVSSNSIKALANRILSEARGGSSSDCKPQCDKAGSNRTVTTKTNGGSQCPPTCDNKASSKTVTTKGSTTTTGGGNPNCKPRD